MHDRLIRFEHKQDSPGDEGPRYKWFWYSCFESSLFPLVRCMEENLPENKLNKLKNKRGK